MMSQSYRPSLNTLEDRVQPGSVLSQGVDLALVADSLLGNSLLSTVLPDSSVLALKTISQPAGTQQSTATTDVATQAAPAQPLATQDLGDTLTVQGLDNHLPLASPLSSMIGARGSNNVGTDHQRLIPSDALFYGGDDNFYYGIASEYNTAVTDSAVFDNFFVPRGNSWYVDDIFSHHIFLGTTTFSTAYWEIRQDVSAGTGGILVASSSTPQGDPVKITDLGSWGAYEKYELNVDVSSYNLVLPSGLYYVSLAPYGTGNTSTAAFILTSSNNCSPEINNVGRQFCGSSWWKSNYFSANWVNPATLTGDQTLNFAIGVGGAYL
jgi:hypothetical protein